MTKYYRVIKANPLWEVGAILHNCTNDGDGYRGIEDVWNRHKDMTEYLTGDIVENSPEFFERVYSSLSDKLVFLTATELKKAYKRFQK